MAAPKAAWWAVLSPDGLDHIAHHAYVPGKYTPLDNLLNPWWLWLSNQLPMWLAPNLVTFAGFLPMVLAYCMTATFFSPAEPVPRGLALFAGCALWFYQTMDAVDGKQARRTGTSTPLGQLFDHGCDCLACLSHHSIALYVLLPGNSRWGMAGLAGLQTGFFFAQWQEMYTGVLRTSFGCVGVTETQYGLIVGALFAAIAGPENILLWANTDMNILGFHVPAGIVGVQMWCIFCLVLVIICAEKTFRHIIENAAEITLSTADGQPLLQRSLTDLVPVALLNVFLLLWEDSLITRSPRTLFLLTGLLFFYFTVQMIVFSMARMRYPVWQPCLVVYFAMVIFSRAFPDQVALVDLLVRVVTLWTGGCILVWLVSAIRELKARLGIHVFYIDEPSNGNKPSDGKKVS